MQGIAYSVLLGFTPQHKIHHQIFFVSKEVVFNDDVEMSHFVEFRLPKLNWGYAKWITRELFFAFLLTNTY